MDSPYENERHAKMMAAQTHQEAEENAKVPFLREPPPVDCVGPSIGQQESAGKSLYGAAQSGSVSGSLRGRLENQVYGLEAEHARKAREAEHARKARAIQILRDHPEFEEFLELVRLIPNLF